MNWFLLTLTSVFIVSFANILQKVLMKQDKSDPVIYAIAFHLLLGCINLLVVAPFGYQLPVLDSSFVFFLLSATFWGLGTVLLFKALQLLESSEVTIITSSRAFVTIVASLLFLGESFTIGKMIGTILILSSVLLVKNIKHSFRFHLGFWYALGVTFFYGSAVIFDVINLRTYDPLSYLATTNYMIGLLLATIFWRKLSGLTQFWNPHLGSKMLLLGVFSTAQAVAYYLALQIGPSSQIAAINQAQVIVTVLLAAVLLGERDRILQKLVAAGLVTVGILLLR